MASTDGSTIQGSNVYVQVAVFDATGALSAVSPAADGTASLSAVVPADGAELVAASFTVTTIGAHTTSGEQAFSVSDGTNVLFTMPATDAESVLGTIVTCTPGTDTNGKAIGTTAGANLVLTNTETGTVTTAMSGLFRLVWAL